MNEDNDEPLVSEGVVLSNGYKWTVKVDKAIPLTSFDMLATLVVVKSVQAKHFDHRNCLYVRK